MKFLILLSAIAAAITSAFGGVYLYQNGINNSADYSLLLILLSIALGLFKALDK